MKLKQITIATGLALVAGQAMALAPTAAVDFTINSAGSSAQQASLGGVFTQLCQAGTIDTFYDTVAGSNHRAYSCTLKTTLGNALINGKKMLFLHRAQGGSINGVNPVAKGESLARMVVDGTCVATGNVYPVLPQYTCGNTVNAIPDAGVSDEEPSLFKGINLPAGASPLTSSQLGNLSSFSQNAVVFGIATTNNVNAAQPNLSRAQVTTLDIGGYGDWGSVNAALAGKPVILCRRTPGSGSQAAMNAYFPGVPCLGSAAVTPLDKTANSVTDGSALTVIENSSTGAVANCLNAAFNGGAFTDAYGTVFNLPAGSAAFGILSTEKQPAVSDKWKFSNIDGIAATVLNATTGAYDFYVEQSFQYRNKDICVGGADTPHATPCHGGEVLVLKPTATQNAFMTKFIAASGDPAVISSIPGVAALPSYDPSAYPAGQVMKGTRANNTCQPSQLFW